MNNPPRKSGVRRLAGSFLSPTSAVPAPARPAKAPAHSLWRTVSSPWTEEGRQFVNAVCSCMAVDAEPIKIRWDNITSGRSLSCGCHKRGLMKFNQRRRIIPLTTQESSKPSQTLPKSDVLEINAGNLLENKEDAEASLERSPSKSPTAVLKTVEIPSSSAPSAVSSVKSVYICNENKRTRHRRDGGGKFVIRPNCRCETCKANKNCWTLRLASADAADREKAVGHWDVRLKSEGLDINKGLNRDIYYRGGTSEISALQDSIVNIGTDLQIHAAPPKSKRASNPDDRETVRVGYSSKPKYSFDRPSDKSLSREYQIKRARRAKSNGLEFADAFQVINQNDECVAECATTAEAKRIIAGRLKMLNDSEVTDESKESNK